MNDITPYNCEAFFLDYHEGNLSLEDTAALFAFLSENPEWNTVFEEFAPVGIDPEPLRFPEKELMKHYGPGEIPVITRENCAHFMIAAHEGDLSDLQLDALKSFMAANPAAEPDFRLYGLARLHPEPVEFKEKKGLRKPLPPLTRVVRLWPAALATAAAIAALLLFAPDETQLPGEELPNPSIVGVAITQPAEAAVTETLKPQDIAVKKTITDVVRQSDFLQEREPEFAITTLPAMPAGAVEFRQVPARIESINRVYTAVYADMMMRWQIEANESRPGLLARLARPVTSIFQGRDAQTEEPLPGRNPLTLWTLAEYSVRGLNSITRNNLELRHSRDENGRLVAFALQGENFKLARVKPPEQNEEESQPQE